MVQATVTQRVSALEKTVEELATKHDLHASLEQRTAEILAIITASEEETRRVLREEIRAGDEETRRYMRVLHEDVIERLERLRG